MLARARERALAAGLAHASFVDADAQTYAFEPARADAVFSRFGVMFFHDPVAAFANLRGALRPGGRAGLLCWQAFERNPWMALPAAAAARHVPMPPRPSPGAPGPFGLADPTHVRAVLEGAGFADVALDPIETSLIVGGTPDLDEAAAFATLFGPTAAVLRDATAGLVQEVQASVREALAPYHTAEGVRLSASLWFVRARRA
jgi:SAM-dependent methyltransferase